MIIISHRGNLEGIDRETENTEQQIQKAICLGFHVEVDVWLINDKVFLGHDGPENESSLSFLKNEMIWCHAKNIEAFNYLLENNVHVFWHQTDDVVLTSLGYLWTFPGKKLTKNSICVLPENSSYSDNEVRSCAGMCTDYPKRYKHDLQL